MGNTLPIHLITLCFNQPFLNHWCFVQDWPWWSTWCICSWLLWCIQSQSEVRDTREWVQQDGLKYHWDSNTPVQAFLQESSARFELTCWKTAESCMFHSAANSWKRWQWWKYFRFTRCALLLYHSPQLISWWRGVYWDSCCLSRLIGETFKVVTGFQEGVQSKNPKRVEESRSTLHTAFKGSVEAFRSCTAICEEHSP